MNHLTLEISHFSALIGIALSAILIIKNTKPIKAMILGSLLGCIIGGVPIFQSFRIIFSGIYDFIPVIIRVIAASILGGVIVKSGAGETIGERVVSKFSIKYGIFGITLATMILTSLGVFPEVAIITIATIALIVANKYNYSKPSILLGMIGGTMCGTVISLNQSTVALATVLNIDLATLIDANFGPSIGGFIVTVALANCLNRKNPKLSIEEEKLVKEKKIKKFSILATVVITLVAILFLLSTSESGRNFLMKLGKLPILLILLILFGLFLVVKAIRLKSDTSILSKNPKIYMFAGIFGTLVAITLIILNDTNRINLDPTYGILLGGLFGTILIGKTRSLSSYASYGIAKSMNLVSLLIGVGAITGMIKASNLVSHIFTSLNSLNVPSLLIIPILGIGMSAFTGSTVAGAALVGSILLNIGISTVTIAPVILASSTVFSNLPHGIFFNETAGVVDINRSERFKLLAFQVFIGLVITIISVIIYLEKSSFVIFN